jgi:hypothetical protein
MNRWKMLGSAALAALMVLATAGPALAKPLPEKQWRKRASAICKAETRKIGELDAALLLDYVEPTPEQAAAFVAQAVPVFEGLIAAIDALKEPKSLKQDVARLVATATEELDAVRADPSLVIELDGAVLPKAQKINDDLGIKC